MPTHTTGPCLWITQANWETHQAEYDDYHIHIIEEETKRK